MPLQRARVREAAENTWMCSDIRALKRRKRRAPAWSSNTNACHGSLANRSAAFMPLQRAR